MAHVAVPEGVQGRAGLVAYKRSTGEKLLALANEVLRGPSPLTPAERELIAAFVSEGNDCSFCSQTHQAVASQLLDDGLAATTPTDDATYAFIGSLLGEQGYHGQLAGPSPD